MEKLFHLLPPHKGKKKNQLRLKAYCGGMEKNMDPKELYLMAQI